LELYEMVFYCMKNNNVLSRELLLKSGQRSPHIYM